jgi:hypothetical protein
MSPSFSSFRELMDKWDASKRIFEESDLCMFFKRDGRVYGVTEPGRITFARMKNPENKEDLAWKKDASMVIYDLERAAEDMDAAKSVVSGDDISELEPISQEKAEKILKKKGVELPAVKEEDDDGAYYGEE